MEQIATPPSTSRARGNRSNVDDRIRGREVHQLGVPWETQYGYTQAVRVGNIIHVSGQLSHDEHTRLVAAAPLNDAGQIVDYRNMEARMRQTYVND